VPLLSLFVSILIVGLAAHPVAAQPAAAQPAAAPSADTSSVLEVRVYTLKRGVRADFHERFVRESLPLLRRARVDVVAYGPSLHDEDSYFLMRAFPGVAARERAEAEFYGSREWIEGPRDAVLAAIDTYTTAVVAVDAATLKGLRAMSTAPSPAPAADDVAALTRLNQDYIDAVRSSNVRRFSEILAEDFLCTLADGTLVNRAEFLERAGEPTTALALEAHDVQVRLLGDTAIVHAATSFMHPDGTPGRGRYTDVWARRNGRWVAVAAQFARQ
jgi:ketosteroid isomerase-like protein